MVLKRQPENQAELFTDPALATPTSQRVDFSTIDPGVYAEHVARRAVKNPNYEQDVLRLKGTGIKPDPAGLDRVVDATPDLATEGRTVQESSAGPHVKSERVPLTAHLKAARAILDGEMPLFGIPRDNDRIVHRRAAIKKDAERLNGS